MPAQRWESCALVAEVCWRRLALWRLVHVTQASRHPGFVTGRAGLVATSFLKESLRTKSTHLLELLVHRFIQWTWMGCVRQKARGMRPLSCIDRSQRCKGQNDKKGVGYHEQRKSHGRSSRLLVPKRSRTLLGGGATANFRSSNTASGRILRCRGRSLAGTLCTLIYACLNGALVLGGLRRTSRTGGGKFNEWLWWPRERSQDETDGTLDSPPKKDWSAQVQALAANPAWTQEQFALWQLLHQQYQHLQYERQLVSASTKKSLVECFPRTSDPPWSGG